MSAGASTFDFQRIFQCSPGRIVVLAPDSPRFTILAATESYLSYTAQKSEEIVGKSLFETRTALSPDSLIRESLERVLACRREDATMLQESDDERPLNIVHRPVLSESGAVACILHIIEDRCASEETRRESEARFRALADGIPQLCWMANPDGWIFWYNQRWYEYTGTTPQQMEGWGWQSVHDPERLPVVMQRWTESISSGEPFDMVFPLRGIDGKFRPFLTRIFPLKSPDGTVLRWFGTNTDISEQQGREDALRKSKERLDLAVEVADLGEWEVDLETDSAWRSARHAQIFGHETSQPWSLQALFDHVVPEHRAEIEQNIRNSLPKGHWDFDTQIRRADGEIRWIWGRGRAELDKDGRPLRMFGTVMDITERRRVEERIAHLASFPERNPLPIFETDLDGKLTYSNPEANRRFPDLVALGEKHPLVAQCVSAAKALQARGDRTDAIEVEVAGQHLLANVLYAPEMGAIRAYCVDISKRKRFEEDLKRSEERMSSIISSAMDAIISIDEDLNVVVFNDAAESMFCCEAADAYGKALDRFLPESARMKHVRQIHHFGATGQTARSMTSPATLTGRRLDGEIFPIEVTISQSSKGGQKLYTAIVRDITQRKKSEEVARLYEKSKQLDELKTEFFANISHELRTPLTLILGPVRRRLNDSAISDSERHDLELVERNTRVLLRHVNDLLDLSKLDAGKMYAEYVDTDLAQLGRLVAANFESLASERELDFNVLIADTLSIQMDAGKVERILVNLLSNAFKFTPAGGTVTFAITKQGHHAVMEVVDSGPGIPPELREAIFERFRQVDASTSRRYGGTGLGLSIVKQFVQLHGGEVSVTAPASGQGTLFRVVLPLTAPTGTVVAQASRVSDHGVAAEVAEELMPRRNEQPSSTQDFPADTPLVLVVEDNPDMNAFVVEVLSASYRTVSAFDGNEGLQKAIALRPDLILSDIMMPGMSGDQLVGELRRKSELDDVPVVLLTAKADERLVVRLLKEGAQDYLQKPFVAEQLLAKMERLIADRRRAAAETQRLRGLSKHLLQADDQERREIAHQLHEDIAQYLAVLQLNLSSLRNAESITDSRTKETLSEAMSILEFCTTGISALSLALHPSVLEYFGLGAALQGYARSFARSSGIPVDFEYPPTLGRVAAESEYALFRIVQEMLTNLRSLGVERASVRAVRDAEEVGIVITSDRKHGEVDQESSSELAVATSIAAMRERVRLLGGHVEADLAGERMVLRAAIPLGQEE